MRHLGEKVITDRLFGIDDQIPIHQLFFELPWMLIIKTRKKFIVNRPNKREIENKTHLI